jgi:succinate dehydrogenase / fumarate reductase membrane anchor subunit
MNPESQAKYSRPKPAQSSFELFAWFFMRISGVLLVVLAIGHLVIMHLINNIDNVNYDFVVERWATPFWRTYDGLLLILALVHGVNGLRTILDDFLRPGVVRTIVLTLLYVVSSLFLFMGLQILMTFQPQ